jgi:hypothetical protein
MKTFRKVKSVFVVMWKYRLRFLIQTTSEEAHLYTRREHDVIVSTGNDVIGLNGRYALKRKLWRVCDVFMGRFTSQMDEEL